jgi:hypothetical protein
MKSITIGFAASLVLAASTACLADDLAADPTFSGGAIGFALKGNYSNLTLTVAGPGGFHASAFSHSGAPSIDLNQFGPLAEGTYTYQLTAATDQMLMDRTAVNNGRGVAAAVPVRGVATSGTFMVRGGSIVQPGTQAEPAPPRRR